MTSQVEREKCECAELLSLSAGDVTSLDDDVRRLEDDNAQLRRQLRVLDSQMTDAEQQHTDRYTDRQTDRQTSSPIICRLQR